MAKKSVPRRAKGKPAVAHKNQQDAALNIATKIGVLESFKRRLAPVGPRSISNETALTPLLRSLPTSVRQFNAWTSDAVPKEFIADVQPFKTNANDTIRTDDATLLQVQGLVDAVKQIDAAWTGQVEPSRIATLRRNLQLAEALRDIAETELKAQMRVTQSLRSQVSASQQSFDALEREAKAALKERDAIIEKLKAARAAPSAMAQLARVSK